MMTPSEYIADQPVELQQHLFELRRIIESELEEVISKISYGVICYWHHYMLVGLGVTKKGCVSFFTMRNGLLEEIKGELCNIKWNGSTIHLYPDNEVPESLIRKIIRLRIKENNLRKQHKK